LDNLFDRLRRPWMQRALVAGIIAIYVVDIGILEPFPIRTVPDYPVYHLIGADPEDHTLLQVPMGPAAGNRRIGHGEQLAYYARFHHQRTVNGLVSRLPVSQLERYVNSPFLRALLLSGPLPPFDVARAELVRRLKPWDIRYVVVHKDLLDEDQANTFITFFNQQPELCVFDDAQDTIAYRVIASWADCPTPAKSALPPGGKLDLGEPGDQPFIGRGWYRAENIGGPQARWAGESISSTLRLVLPAESLRVHFRAWAYPVGQSVTITVNGFPVASFALVNDWAEYEFSVPANATRAEGPSLITLTHTRLESAFEHTSGAVEDKRPLAAAYDYFVFELAR
jgi:hypothetical protein